MCFRGKNMKLLLFSIYTHFSFCCGCFAYLSYFRFSFYIVYWRRWWWLIVEYVSREPYWISSAVSFSAPFLSLVRSSPLNFALSTFFSLFFRIFLRYIHAARKSKLVVDAFCLLLGMPSEKLNAKKSVDWTQFKWNTSIDFYLRRSPSKAILFFANIRPYQFSLPSEIQLANEQVSKQKKRL